MISAPTWQHRLCARQDHTVLELCGEIDVNTAPQLLHLLQLAITDSARLDVDLRAVEFIDSTVISALIIAHHAALGAGKRFGVVNPTGHVARTLRITGVLTVLAPAGERPTPA